MATKLSVCIPTFNRAEDLRRALWAFLPQLTSEIEVVISDNASSDHTSTVIEDFKSAHPRVVYYRWNENMGADRNFLQVVSLASSDYCWLFGSDDLVERGALAVVLAALDGQHDIYLMNRLVSHADYRPFAKEKWLHAGMPAQTFDTANPAELLRYLRSVRILGGLFSFLSSIVVKRSAWNAIPFDESFGGTAYSHAFMLNSLLRRGCTVQYLPEFLVNCRFGNDSFSSEGVARRILLDIRGFGLISSRVFMNDAAVRDAINRVLCREYPWWRLARRKVQMTSDGWLVVSTALRSIGYSPLRLRAAAELSRISGLIGILLSFKRIWEQLPSRA